MDNMDKEPLENMSEEDEVFDSAGLEDEASENIAASINGNLDGQAISPGTPVYQIYLDYSRETFFAAYDATELPKGTMVAVNTRYGMDLARIAGRLPPCKLAGLSKIARIERVASDFDLEKAAADKIKEDDAFKVCRQKIEELSLEMKLIAAHYMLEEQKVLFFFLAESRVDFRELVKELVTTLRTRIELRQVGNRDDTRMTGGLGICGRQFCCHYISDKLGPVTIKMAKEQNLSLNSTKISGACGRLLCCLAFEHEFYSKQRGIMPEEGMNISYGDTVWSVVEVNTLLGLIKLTAGDGRILELPKTRFEKIGSRWSIKELN
jgi:cell fate regulator YaaT (PSP1 superfamily)